MKTQFKKQLTALLISTVFFLTNTQAQLPQINWQKSLGGSRDDLPRSIDVTTDGGYVIAGGTYSNDGDIAFNNGNSDLEVMKINSTGNILWQKTFGGTEGETGIVIRTISTGGYIVVGSTASSLPNVIGNHGKQDIWVMRLNENGELLWQYCYGGSADDIPYAMELCADGGFVIAACTYSSNGDVTGSHQSGDYWVLKLDAIGNLQWQVCYGGSLLDFAHAVVQSDDGGYVVSGYARSTDGDVVGNHGQEDVWILKLDYLGNLIWKKSYGGTGGEGTSSIQKTSDGGFALLGVTHSNNGDVIGTNGEHEYWLVRINSAGDLLWAKCYGGAATDNGNSIKRTSDGGFILSGLSDSFDSDVLSNNGSHDYSIIKVDNNGVVKWQKSLGGSRDEEAMDIVEAVDGNFVIAGYSYSNDVNVFAHHGDTTSCDYWIVKLSDCIAPVTTISSSGTSFCPGAGITLNANAGDNAYQWRKNNADIPGATNPSYYATEFATFVCRADNGC